MQSSNLQNAYSDFWLPEENFFDEKFLQSSIDSYSDIDLIKININKKIIQNFVNILTNKCIEVEFQLNDDNLPETDGQTIKISSKILNRRDFDVVVGLALHEASHILLTDFIFLNSIWQKVPSDIYDMTKNNKSSVASLITLIYNIIEDRCIDYFVYNNAIGYRGYYVAFYNKYFYNPIVDDMLQSNMYRIPTIDAYLARTINMMNKNTDLTALPDLYRIYNLIDLKNIKKFNTTTLKFDTACDIARIILKNANYYDLIKYNDPMYGYDDKKINSPEITNDEADKGTADDSIENDAEDTQTNSTEKNEEQSKESNHRTTKDNKKISLKSDIGDVSDKTFKEVMQIKKMIDEQTDLVNGNEKKPSITTAQHEILGYIDKSDIRIIPVGAGLFDGGHAIESIFVKKFTESVINTPSFPMVSQSRFKFALSKTLGQMVYKNGHDNLQMGIQLGMKMGKRLKILNETNTSKFHRKNIGKIDRRLLAEVGVNNEDIFYQYKIHSYDKINLHVSVDASGSMAGEKWDQTMVLTTAICKAATMIHNFDVSVSFRTTVRSKSGGDMPYVLYAYDSRVDKFSKIKKLFPLLEPAGCTPEGLAFESLLRHLDATVDNKQKYFINISDGEPYLRYINWNNKGRIYHGSPASEHTKKQVEMIRNRGYVILSYFIDEGWGDSELFKEMYGKDASFININDLFSIIKTLNTLFLKNVN